MLRNKYLLIGLLLLGALVIYLTFFDGSNASSNASDEAIKPEEYQQQLDAQRAKKDEFLRSDANSPITDKQAFKHLVYFKPDLTYRVTARLEPFADKTQKLVVRMSDGSEEVYDKYAHAVFSLNGKACRLLVVKLENTYSILFRDATSGKQTYGGGRYLELDLDKLTDNHAVLDFNAAYNPYCAYNPSYACPLPPPENTLSIPVEAGEQYEAHE